MSSIRRRSALALIMAMIMLVSLITSVYAAIDPDTFNPRTGNSVYVIRSNNSKFVSEHGGYLTESVGKGSGAALIPEGTEYKYIIKNAYNNNYERAKSYTEKLAGTLAEDKYIDAIAGNGAATLPASTQSGTNRTHYWWFKMSTESGNPLSGFKAPKVKWTGLYIFDFQKNGYQKIDLVMEVVAHSMAGDFSDNVPGLFSVSKGVKGLPSVRLYHIKAIQLNFKAYKAGTDEYYPLKTSITFGDVDGRQSISVLQSCVNGVSAKSSANILFGPYGQGEKWWVATGNTDGNVSDDASNADDYKIAYNIDCEKSGETGFDLAFTSSQKNNNRPTGYFARFSASTYDEPDRPPEPPVIERPVKYVSDGDRGNDEDSGTVKINGIDSPALTHNKLSSKDEAITYTVVQRMPLYMYSSIASTDLSRFEFQDTIDECLEYETGSMKVYSLRDSAEVYEDLLRDPVSLEKYQGSDVTSKFDVSKTGSSIACKWKSGNSASDRDSVLYGGSDGTVLKFVFRAKLKSGLSMDEIRQHSGADGKAHYDQQTGSVVIPNRAKITYKMGSQSVTEYDSVNARYQDSQSESVKTKNSFVYTSISAPPVEVRFDKIDKDSGEQVEGAELAVYKGEFAGSTVPGGNAEEKWTTDGSTHVSTGKFEAGEKYTLVEIKAPDGYNRADNVVFTPDEEKPVQVIMKDELKRADIRVSKNVTGSLGDITKEFSFILSVDNAEPGKKYDVKKGSENAGVTSDKSGRISYEFTLKDEEEIVIKGIPEKIGSKPVTYVVTEKANNHKASYETDTGKKGANESSDRDLSTETMTVGIDREISYTNDRELTPPTGNSTTPEPYIPGLIIFAEAALYMLIRRMAG